MAIDSQKSNSPSIGSPAVEEERMKLGYMLESVFPPVL